MNKKRLLYGLLLGALFGIVCIIGANVRSTESLSNTYLFAFWYNRVIIGLVIGLLPILQKRKEIVVRGAIIGLLISFAFFSTTGFQDIVGFLVGAIYGILIELILEKSSNKKEKN